MSKSFLKSLIPRKIKKIVKQYLYNKFGFLNVTRPYRINILEDGRFKNKVVVVTGGSGAIGRSICCRLALEGAVVYVCGLTERKINAVVEEIKGLGCTAYPCIIDVRDNDSIKKSFDKIVEIQGKLDVLVACAGGSAREDSNYIHEQKSTLIEEIIRVNLVGSVLCSRLAAQQMILRREGKIVMLSSAIGVNGKAGFSEYAASKGGIISYTKSLATELGKYGINVNCVSPGIVQRNRISNSQLKLIKGTNYLNSFGKPEDIANMVVFLISDEASFITGQNFIVDGGRTLGLKGD